MINRFDKILFLKIILDNFKTDAEPLDVQHPLQACKLSVLMVKVKSSIKPFLGMIELYLNLLKTVAI